MYQILTTATPMINNWSRLSDTDRPDPGGACANDDAEDDGSDHHDLNTDCTASTKSLLNSGTPCNNADSSNDNQTVIHKNSEYLSYMASSRVRDPRRTPLSVISEGVSVDHVSEDIDDDEVRTDMAQLKATTARLKLATRRPSYVAWQAQVQQRPKNPPPQENIANDILTEERKNWITNALQWITEELVSWLTDNTYANANTRANTCANTHTHTYTYIHT